MKKIFLIILVFSFPIYATGVQYSLGLKYSKYGSVGIGFDDKWGVSIENSIFVEYLKFQYVRLNVFYRFKAPFDMSGFYALYTGMRYNRDYFDVGGILYLQKKFFDNRVSIRGLFQPCYDSDLKRQYGYLGEAQVKIFSEVGIVGGIKNIAEYRENEQRFYGGLFFDLPHMYVRPEISVPANMKMSTARVSVSFFYRNFIR